MKTLIQKPLALSFVAVLLMSGCSKVNFTPVLDSDSASIIEPVPSKTISSTEVVAYGNKQVDFLLVLDDSNSMLPELKKLAARMATFLTSIEASNIDWQMCLTTTRGLSSGGSLVYGSNYSWYGYTAPAGSSSFILKKGTANLHSIFVNTIDNLTIGGGASGDERGIKATYDHFTKGNPSLGSATGCYRTGAAVSVIMISDEDERSVGGVAANIKSNDAAGSLLALEFDDQPVNLISHSKLVFGDDVRFTFSSIILKPGDLVCEAEQDQDTSPSHFGYVYEEMSRLTDGGVGSICDADYSASLNTFKDKIVNSMSHLALECVPKPATLQVSIEGQRIQNYKLEKDILKFTYALVEGTQIDLKYECAD